MATKEQKNASGKLMAAVTALNDALSACGRVGLTVELMDVRNVDSVPRYVVTVIEARETVLPDDEDGSL